MVLAAAVSAVLLASAGADAKAGKNRNMGAAQATQSAAVCDGSGPGPMGRGMFGAGGPGGSPGILENFDAIDADKSGSLSKEELTTWFEQRREQFRLEMQERVKAADTDGNGLLTRDEARLGLPHLYEHFEFVDANGDGSVSLAELEQLRDRDQLRQRIQDRVKAADKDQDGKLNLAEVQAAFPGLAPRFAALDKDGDGFLTVEDFGRFMGPH
jgi:Ca2+-binding EF-hand superfamily protein